MGKTAAIVILTNLTLIFVLGVVDLLVHPASPLIPEYVLKLASVILAGVAVGIILISLRQNNSDDE